MIYEFDKYAKWSTHEIWLEKERLRLEGELEHADTLRLRFEKYSAKQEWDVEKCDAELDLLEAEIKAVKAIRFRCQLGTYHHARLQVGHAEALRWMKERLRPRAASA